MGSTTNLSVAAFFAGAGGLDLGFKNAGFSIPYANEFDKTIWKTYQNNFPETLLDQRNILDIKSDEIPTVTGFIGGPPCQSWSEAGAARGINDERGKLFFTYMELVGAKMPTFFQAENVSGILFSRHSKAFRKILIGFAEMGYNISYGLLRASNYEVPQDRDRVFIVGYRTDQKLIFIPPKEKNNLKTLEDAIWDLRKNPKSSDANKTNGQNLAFPNHEYMLGSFSSIFMSRNRVRTWSEPSFTIQAGARHAPLHPQAPKMENIGKDKFQFKKGFESQYRRLSVREAARIQTFPDNFIFYYSKITDGYKMIGNAVPVRLAEAIAKKIFEDFALREISSRKNYLKGDVYTFQELLQNNPQLPFSISA